MIENIHPERRLVAAILKRAVKDARDGNGHSAEARRWLRSERAGVFLDALGIRSDQVAGFLAGLEPVQQTQLPGL
jgi:hypothetical protein